MRPALALMPFANPTELLKSLFNMIGCMAPPTEEPDTAMVITMALS